MAPGADAEHFFHLIHIVEKRLPNIVLGPVFLVKIVQRRFGRVRKPGGSGWNMATFACHGVHVVGSQTRNCFLPQTCKHLVHSTDIRGKVFFLKKKRLKFLKKNSKGQVRVK